MTTPAAGVAPAAMLLLLPVLLGLLLAAAPARADCSGGQRGPQARFSSKTAYELVHGVEEAGSSDVVAGCTAVYLWHTLRHGTRYPSSKQAHKLAQKVPAVQARLAKAVAAGRTRCHPEAVHDMLSWTLNVTDAQGNTLHRQGELDLQGIGRRLRRRYPEFFGRHPHPNNFTFRSTDTQRTQASAKWYGNGLFEEPITLPQPLPDDPLLKFYDLCPAWTKAVDKNASARAEVTAFAESDVMRQSLARISERLGEQDPLLYDDADAIWEACRYNQAWDPRNEAAWCAPFDEEDLRVFEYHEDMKYYYVDGYGNDMNLRLGCPLVKDLIDKMSTYERGEATSAGAMYFTHSTAVHMTLAVLGVGRDVTPLTAANYETMKNDRRWAISRLAPFAANLAAVLYECPANISTEKYKVRLYVNEEPVTVEGWGCSDTSLLCSWTDFKRHFENVSSTCSLDFCGGSGGGEVPSAAEGRHRTAAARLLPLLATAVAALLLVRP